MNGINTPDFTSLSDAQLADLKSLTVNAQGTHMVYMDQVDDELEALADVLVGAYEPVQDAEAGNTPATVSMAQAQ
ncbi:hypothetical protein GNF76_05170 [Pseudomonas sp. CCM 7893]|uniref:Uncharacterized protein n=1 Tax=Pseudomonas spelaei TaxID=1055469 RepID=A0A6I3W974_9PSED|nr:hypothetical protein [Pseudomonas spelaei]MUF03712.1 hypothetical protein [Pseudomonas spelaei]